MNFFKNKGKKVKNLLKGEPEGGQRLDSGSGAGSSSGTRAPPARDAAALALERRLQEEQNKKAQEEVRRRERQLRADEEREMRFKFGDMSLEEHLEQQRKLQNDKAASAEPTESADKPKRFNPVLYTSPIVNNGLIAAPRNELFSMIHDVIASTTVMGEDEQREYAARLFHMANSGAVKEKALERVRKIIQFIVANPTEPKYRIVKRQHQLYSDSVLPAVGAELFLKLIGFEIANMEDKGEVLRLKDNIELDLLPFYLEMMETAQTPLELSVYRHAKVYFLAKDAKIEPIHVPEETYKLTGAEVQALQKQRERETEFWLTVCSKRPRVGLTPFNISIVRVRFPNDAIMEAMFGIHETTGDIVKYVAQVLDIPTDAFYLKEAVGERFDSESTQCIGEIKLVPYALLHFCFADKDGNTTLPSPEHSKLCNDVRNGMTIVGVDISDYKF